MQVLRLFDLSQSSSTTCMNVWRNERSEQTHCRPLLWLKANATNQHFSHTCSAVKNLLSTTLLNHCLPHSMPNYWDTYPHTHTRRYTFMPSKASQKCYDPHPSMIVRSCIGGLLLLHPFACLNILAWLCIIQAEGNNHQYSFCNRKTSNNEMKSEVKHWIHLKRGFALRHI